VTLFLVRNSSCQDRCASPRNPNSTHNQSVELGKAVRQSFVLLLMQNQSGLNNRRSSFTEFDKRTELDCENRPLYTQIFWKVPNSWKVPKGICTSCSPQEMRVRAFSERDQSESRMRLCSCSICSSCLLLDAWLVSKFISISLSSYCWW